MSSLQDASPDTSGLGITRAPRIPCVATDTASDGLTTLGCRPNEIIEVLMIFGGIFLPLTSMTGTSGMSFEYRPDFQIGATHPILLGAMVVIAGAKWALFRTRGWIGRRRDE